jgi:DNA repair protein RecO (recombination protein O)
LIKRIESAAVLVRSIPYGEADVVAAFFTEKAGKLAAIVRGARRSAKRFGGALEPIHELFVIFEDKGRELCVLKEARIDRVRAGIVADLGAMDIAGRALRWVRHLCPPRTPEPAAWRSLRELLDALDRPLEDPTPLAQHLAIFGLRLLADAGYALELERCVRCARPCPATRRACIDAAGGGLVCASCGGARRTISAELRALALAAQRGGGLSLSSAQATALVTLAEEAMAAHAGFDAQTR